MLSRALLLSVMLLVLPGTAPARDEPVDRPTRAGHYIASVFLSIFYVPVKLVTCVSGQALGGAAYLITAGVPGNYDGGTNGAEIGTIAAASCAPPWIIKPKDLNRDYRSDPEPIDYGD